MSKELTSLETFELLCRSYVDDINTFRHKEIKEDYFYNEKYGVTITDIKNGSTGETANVKKSLKALDIIKKLFDFDFAIRFGDNQPMIKITNKRNGQYWELPETTEICDLLKEELL